MASLLADPSELAAALRAARRTRRVSIASLAAQAGVSPRLISEFERNMRPHISLETALRLLALMQVPVTVAAAEHATATTRAERAARRRQSWTGYKTTLAEHDLPQPPASAAMRLTAVAKASRLAAALGAARTVDAGQSPPVGPEAEATRAEVASSRRSTGSRAPR